MDKKGNKIFGFFNGQIEVQDKIDELRNGGYPSDNMYVIAKDNEQINGLRSYSEAHFSTEQDGDWIDKFKDMFSGDFSLKNVFEEMGFSREEAEEYNRRIEQGEIFLFADDEVFEEEKVSKNSGTLESSPETAFGFSGNSNMSRTERRKNRSDTKEESLLLHEEQLEVHKEPVQTGEVNVNKRIVEEQQDLDVPIERDEVTVERRPITDQPNADAEIQSEPYKVGDELHIPVIEERLIVTKKEVVVEEIVITKRKINDTKHISETIRREVVDIDDEDLPPNSTN